MSVGEVQAWLCSEWHVQVPPAWLDACVNWIKEEADRESVPQSQLNQRVLEQWLLTDLRDLAHPVFPERISEVLKTELDSCYCVQMDSLLDISQPAYTQLQRIRGTDCSNDQVSAVTQETQRPWEAKPTRMLMLQLTDGVQSLEGMEYRPIPALSANLPPGTKLQLVGPIVVRLGVLLLKAENVKVLGGEVEQLLEIYSQGRVLCGTLGLPEENHQQGEEPDDQELLASVEAVVDHQVADSGYASLTSEASFRPSSHLQSQPRPQVTPIPREDDWDNMDEIPDDDFRSIPDNFDDVPQSADDDMMDYIPEDFDDIPLEELDNVMCPIDSQALPSTREHSEIKRPDSKLPTQPKTEELNPSSLRTRTPLSNTHQSRNLHEGLDAFGASSSSTREHSEIKRPDSKLPTQPKTEELNPSSLCTRTPLSNTHQSRNLNEALDAFGASSSTSSSSTREHSEIKRPDSKLPTQPKTEELNPSSLRTRTPLSNTHQSRNLNEALDAFGASSSTNRSGYERDGAAPMYLCTLQAGSWPPSSVQVLRLQAFIVTLVGNLRGSGGAWKLGATISDGTGYLDVDLSDAMLTNLIGFSSTEARVLRKDPARRSEVDAGILHCQRELVDMCCMMSVKVDQTGRGVVLCASPLSDRECSELQRRVKERRN